MLPLLGSLKRFIRWTIFPLYFGLYFVGFLTATPLALTGHGLLLLAGVWAFAKRPATWRAWTLAALLSAFYLALYWTEAFTPLAVTLGLKSKWTLYGALYTITVLGFGADFICRHRHSRYQVLRTFSLMGFQLLFSFLIPLLMPLLSQPSVYLSYLWPLKIEYFYPDVLAHWPMGYVVWSLLAALVLSPGLALLVGKRFYCSWVCGCGGLAETLGDRWRSLSDKSSEAWKFERVSIHAVLVLSIATTAFVGSAAYLAAHGGAPAWIAVGAQRIRAFYGFVITAAFAGVLGVGAYPILGSRVWCRFFCPMAALLGLVQKGGRFRIRVKDDMCISCGNCSACCEMGIDVRAYAQDNTSFTRASCVGCGMCAHVCPRGVLRLENG